MKKIIVSVPDKEYPFFMKLVKSFDFVQLKTKEKKGASKKEFLDGIREAVEEVKLIKAGKLKGRSAEDLINEL